MPLNPHCGLHSKLGDAEPDLIPRFHRILVEDVTVFSLGAVWVALKA